MTCLWPYQKHSHSWRFIDQNYANFSWCDLALSMADFCHWRVTLTWLPSKIKCHSKPHGLKACATKSRVHPDLQIYLKRDISQNRSRKIMRTRRSLIHIYWIAQDSGILWWVTVSCLGHNCLGCSSFSLYNPHRHIAQQVATAAGKRQTPLLSCILSTLRSYWLCL